MASTYNLYRFSDASNLLAIKHVIQNYNRNELYVDIAIEPIKSVEFIYIPLRIKNTGEIAKLGN